MRKFKIYINGIQFETLEESTFTNDETDLVWENLSYPESLELYKIDLDQKKENRVDTFMNWLNDLNLELFFGSLLTNEFIDSYELKEI